MPTADVEAAIAACTWPEQNAPRIQAVLRLISDRRTGVLSLDFLKEMSVSDARAWLEALPGVGPKTSAAVLSFSTLRMAALPVDCHHHRVAQRLGLIGPKVDVGPAHALLAAQLPPTFTPQEVYDNHEVLMLHGQRCCYHAEPACGRCPVLDVCPFGQRRTSGQGGGKAAQATASPPPGSLYAAHDADHDARQQQRPQRPADRAEQHRPGRVAAGEQQPCNERSHDRPDGDA